MSKPRVTFNPLGPSGNVYAIMGAVQRALGREEYAKVSAEMAKHAADHPDDATYDAALKIFRRYVDLVDLSGTM